MCILIAPISKIISQLWIAPEPEHYYDASGRCSGCLQFEETITNPQLTSEQLLNEADQRLEEAAEDLLITPQRVFAIVLDHHHTRLTRTYRAAYYLAWGECKKAPSKAAIRLESKTLD